MLRIGDYAVCPGHGVGQVIEIEERALGDEVKYFYTIKVISNGMNVMIPVDSKDGVRGLIDNGGIDEVFALLKHHDVKVDTSTWNRRYRDYMAKIKTGSLLEIAEVLRDLFLLKNSKNLSDSEKDMLKRCRDLIAQEISLSMGQKKEEVIMDIDSCFGDSSEAC